jgi:glutamine cyclotransferase
VKFVVLVAVGLLSSAVHAASAVDVIRNLDRNSYVELQSTVANKIFLHFSPLPFIEGMQIVKVNGQNHFLITNGGIRPDTNPTGVKLVNAATGELAHKVSWQSTKKDYSDDPFGEGVVLFHDDIVHISFTPGLGYVMDFNSLLNDTASYTNARVLNYSGEGWSLAAIQDDLIINGQNMNGTILTSDGSTLRFCNVNGNQLTTVGTSMTVLDGDGSTLVGLNELEYLGNGLVLENIWTKDLVNPPNNHINHPYIEVIDLNAKPQPRVIAKIRQPQEMIDYANALPYIDLPNWDVNGNITSVVTKFTSVTNGIAVDDEGNLYQAGKNWNRIYQLNVLPTQIKD